MIIKEVRTKNEMVVIHDIFCKSSKNQEFDEFMERWHNTGNKFYFIFLGAENIIGYMLITKRNEIGYFILPEYQRHGYGSKAVKLLIKKEKRNYYWAMIPNNRPHSADFIKTLGFELSGAVYAKQGLI